MKRLILGFAPFVCGMALTALGQANPTAVLEAAAAEPSATSESIPSDPGAVKATPPKPGGHPSNKRAISAQNRRTAELRAYAINNEVFGGQRASRPLMIRSSRADPKVMEQLSQDLTVMARILEKTVAEHTEGFQPPKAAGIDILTLAGSAARSARTMYVDDYGAIFTLSVNMPLKPEPKPDEVAEKETKRKGAWEDAWNEVYGQKRRIVTKRWQPNPGREFDQGEVDVLKTSLVDALKNAANIRHVKPTDMITVVVRGTPFAEQEGEVSLQLEGNSETETVIVDGPANPESTMVLRINKLDLDKAINGRDSGDLRKNVRISIY
jgi:hypothetical protein